MKDDTPAICDEYAAKYPTIVKAIHQENGGHGEGVNQGIRNEMCIRDRPTVHPPPFQRRSVRSSMEFYFHFNLTMGRSPGFGPIICLSLIHI